MTTWKLLADAPDIPGISFRPIAGPDDYPEMARVMNAAMAANGNDEYVSADDIRRNYEHLDNCDPATDTIFVEVDGTLQAYGRVMWWEEAAGARRYLPFGYLHPDVRRRGLGTAMLAHNEARIRQIAAGHETDTEKTLVVYHSDQEVGAMALYEAAGYVPAEFQANLVRPNLNDIPEAPMPEGLVVRTAREDEMRKVFDAATEAFRDHPGFAEPTENDFQLFLDSPQRDPELWRVAWDGDEVAGQVRSFIREEENEALGRKRGWTEEISVRRPYRRRGLARSLLVQSLHAVKERGMEEAALGVSTENPTGAFDLYKSVGFELVRLWTQRRKPV